MLLIMYRIQTAEENEKQHKKCIKSATNKAIGRVCVYEIQTYLFSCVKKKRMLAQ